VEQLIVTLNIPAMGCCLTAAAKRIPTAESSFVTSSAYSQSSGSCAPSPSSSYTTTTTSSSSSSSSASSAGSTLKGRGSASAPGAAVIGRSSAAAGTNTAASSSSTLSSDILVGVFGDTVNVPSDFATLKEALAHAPARARETFTIRMQEGTFNTAVVHVPNVRIMGAGAGKTKLVGSLVVVGGVKGCFVSGVSIMCSRGAGVDLSGRGTQLELSECRVADCDGSGVVAGEGSECTLVGCVVEKNQAHGVTGHGACTHIMVADTEVRYNQAHGVCAEHGCTITLRRGVTVDHNGRCGLFASFDQSRIRVLRQQGAGLADTTNKGGACGAELGGTVEMDDDEIKEGALQYICVENKDGLAAP
jgi:hypothetical protein